MFGRLCAYMKGILTRQRAERELDEELRFHVENEIQANLARGMGPTEARRLALREMGGVTQTKEAVRDVRATLFDALWQDLRFASRILARSPGFTAAAMLTLALGIGANTAVFSLVNRVLLRPLQVSEPDRLLVFSKQYPQDRLTSSAFQYHEFQVFQDQARLFSGIAAEGRRFVGMGTDEGTQRVSVVFVSPRYFHILGLRPEKGRWFLDEEEREGATPVAVVTQAVWRAWFHADPSVVGKSFRLTGLPVTVVGVAPAVFSGTDLSAPGDVFVPLAAAPALAAVKENFFASGTVTTEDGAFSPTSWLRVVGRLRPDVTAAAAKAEVAAIARRASSTRKEEVEFSLTPAAAAAVPDRFRDSNVRLAWLLAGIVGLVLLVGCTGLSGLMLAQTESRRRELATRATLGASRGRLLRQLLVEILMLAGVGAGLGLGVAWAMLSVLSSFELPGLSLERLQPALDLRVVAFAGTAAAVTAMLFGSLPAWRASFALDVSHSLKAQGRATGRGRSLLQPAALALQVALTLVLLVGAGLFIRSVQAGLATDLGFPAEGLTVIELNPGLRRYSAEAATALTDAVIERLKGLPGVENVTIGDVPFRGFTLSGSRLGADGERKPVRPSVGLTFVDSQYFRTMGIPLLRGRPFTRSDTATSAPVAIVNETLARNLWGTLDPLGRRVTDLPVRGDRVPRQAEVVGVARDIRQGLGDGGTPGILYLLRVQVPVFNKYAATVTVRAAEGTRVSTQALRRQVAAVDPDLPIVKITTMEEQTRRALMTPRLGAWLTGWFSILALSLGVVGVYGIVAFAVARRTSEIGVRIALGATPSRIPLLMIRVGLAPVVIGVFLGAAAAWPVTRLIKGFLFGVPPGDPVSFAGAVLVLLAVSVTAGYFGARRAARLDPVRALRAE